MVDGATYIRRAYNLVFGEEIFLLNVPISFQKINKK